MRKFAWLPAYVETWRPNITYAWVWLQWYSIETGQGKFTPLGGFAPIGTKSINYLGFFSYER